MKISTFAGWVTMVLFVLIHRGFGVSMYDTYRAIMINKPQIEMTIKRLRFFFWPTGKCEYQIIGRGVDDTIVDSCPVKEYNFDQVNTDNYYTYLCPDYNPLGLYTDTFGTLVIIKGTGCRLRTYMKKSFTKVTHTEWTLSTAVCDKIMKKLEDVAVKLDDYEAKWKVNYERRMDKLPPLYDLVKPLEDQPPTPSLYVIQPKIPASVSPSDIKIGT